MFETSSYSLPIKRRRDQSWYSLCTHQLVSCSLTAQKLFYCAYAL